MSEIRHMHMNTFARTHTYFFTTPEKICKLVFTIIESEHDYTWRQPVACSHADGSKGPTAGVT